MIDYLHEEIYPVSLSPPVSVYLGSGSWWMGCATWPLVHKVILEIIDLVTWHWSAVHLKPI